MPDQREPRSPTPADVAGHYASGYEVDRLKTDVGRLERERSRELIRRFLPPPPATVLDVGGAGGDYACWLARLGYAVHLVDLVPLHVEEARRASAAQPEAPLAGAEVGDARSLPWEDGRGEGCLLFGPLYHLTERGDRLAALGEARRVLKRGGVLLAAGISRFASALDGLRTGWLARADFMAMVEEDLATGRHHNPTGEPEFFMDTYFHHPDALRHEVAAAGFAEVAVHGVEGPGWLAPDFDGWWRDETRRERLLRVARAVETEPSLLGASAHLVAVGRKP
jgi:SAM-dependent methyltransferase